MHSSVRKLILIQNKVKEIISKKQLKSFTEIIAVTKTFKPNIFLPLLENGHIHFGENKLQEAESKWPEIKKKYVESGKVQIILIDFPLDQAAFNASKLLHCLNQEKRIQIGSFVGVKIVPKLICFKSAAGVPGLGLYIKE